MLPGRQELVGFDPRTIPGCQIWLDAADSNTITVTSSNVSLWRDKSSNAYSFSNGASRGPTRTATLNGRDVLTFTAASRTDASGQFLSGTVRIPINLTQHSFFLVHRPSVIQSNYGNTNAIAFANLTNQVRFPISTTANVSLYSNSLLSSTAPYPTNDVSTAYNLTVAIAGVESVLTARNGVAQSGPLEPGPSSNFFVFDMCATIATGVTATPSNFYSGNIAEILVYSNTLSSDEQRQVEGYLAWKWGLQSNLPTTLSYSSNPPTSRPFTPIDIADCIIWFDAADTRTLTTSGTTVTQWRNKGTLDISGGGGVGTMSTGYTFKTSPLNTIQFPGGSYFLVNNVVTTTPARTQFFIFTVTTFGDGYGRIFASSNTTSNHQAGFNAWNRDTNSVNFYPAALSATEFMGCAGQSPYSGTLPYDATPFVMGIRHTASSPSNNTAPTNRISINGKSVTLATSQKLNSGYFVGSSTFILGTGPGYSNVQQIGEVLQYNRALTDAEMIEVEGYLCSKWNVTIADTSHAFYRIPPAVPASFYPSLMAGCRLWLDAADVGTITATGSSVTSWRDKSGFGFTITFAANPTTGTTQQNGNNVLVFAASRGSNLNCIINAAEHTLIAVHKPSAADSNTNLFRFQTGVASPYVVFPYYSSSTARGWVTSVDGAALSNTGAGLPEGSPTSSYSLITAAITSGSQEIFRNGSRVASATEALTTSNMPGLTIGATTTGTEPYGGNVGELIIYNTKLSAFQRQLVEGYLVKKWGL